MTGPAPRVDVEALRRGVSLLSLLPADAKPRRTGKDAYAARCSFHEDDRPSMSVRLVSIGWVFNCFACGERGDVLGYYMRTRKVAFRDALRQLANGGFEQIERPSPLRSLDVLVCDCGATKAISREDVPLVGVFAHARWHLSDAGRVLCPNCVDARLFDAHWHASLARKESSNGGEKPNRGQ